MLLSKPRRWLGLALVLIGCYAYLYSDLVVRRVGTYIHAAAVTILWAEILIVQLLNLQMGVDAIIGLLAVTSLVIHVLQATVSRDSQYTRSLPTFGLLLGMLPVAMGMIVYMQHAGPREIWADQLPRWSFVAAMLLSALASRVGATIYQKLLPKYSLSYHSAAGASVMIAAAAGIAMIGGMRWDEHAP